MTDKDNKPADDIAVEGSALSNVFKRLHEQDDISPSAELDQLILKQAADAIAGEASTETATVADAESVEKPIDIKFRRQQLEKERERRARRKKSFLPIWAMPMGLAAAVLISFGVVTRVMQSPEFMQPAGSEYISEVQTSDYLSPETAGADVPVSDSMMSRKQDEQKRDQKERSDKDAQGDVLGLASDSSVDIEQRRQKLLSKKVPTVNAETTTTDQSLADNVDNYSPPPPAESVQVTSASVGSTAHVDENRSDIDSASFKVEQTDGFSPELAAQSAPAAMSPPSLSPMTRSTADIGQNEPSLAESESIEAANDAKSEIDAAVILDDSEMGDFATESASKNPVDEGTSVVTGSRYKYDADTNMPAFESIPFELRECQTDLDCALIVGNECTGCDCIETINPIKGFELYSSDLSEKEIKAQCVNTKAECIRGYCQVTQLENNK